MEVKKISDIIKRLEQMKKLHGDLPCISASDDEGNSYGLVYFDATPMQAQDIMARDIEIISGAPSKPNCICIN